MKTKQFGVDKFIYDADIYDAQNSFTHDIPFYLEYAKKAKGPVLELCCGSGRITIPLAKAGIDITGLDYTASMITAAKEKAKKAGLSIPFIQKDMKKLEPYPKYNMIFIPFNSFQNSYSIEDVDLKLQKIRSCLKKNGLFIFDIFNPSISRLANNGKLKKGFYKFTTSSGKKVVIDEISNYDISHQVVRAEWNFYINGKLCGNHQLDMRCFFPMEIDAILKYNGFKILNKFGDFKKKVFASESMKQIFVCKQQ